MKTTGVKTIILFNNLVGKNACKSKGFCSTNQINWVSNWKINDSKAKCTPDTPSTWFQLILRFGKTKQNFARQKLNNVRIRVNICDIVKLRLQHWRLVLFHIWQNDWPESIET